MGTAWRARNASHWSEPAPVPDTSKQGSQNEFYGAHGERRTRDADGFGNREGYSPPQPTIGVGGSVVSFLIRVRGILLLSKRVRTSDGQLVN